MKSKTHAVLIALKVLFELIFDTYSMYCMYVLCVLYVLYVLCVLCVLYGLCVLCVLCVLYGLCATVYVYYYILYVCMYISCTYSIHVVKFI